jgi:hypothetical protein
MLNAEGNTVVVWFTSCQEDIAWKKGDIGGLVRSWEHQNWPQNLSVQVVRTFPVKCSGLITCLQCFSLENAPAHPAESMKDREVTVPGVPSGRAGPEPSSLGMKKIPSRYLAVLLLLLSTAWGWQASDVARELQQRLQRDLLIPGERKREAQRQDSDGCIQYGPSAPLPPWQPDVCFTLPPIPKADVWRVFQ